MFETNDRRKLMKPGLMNEAQQLHFRVSCQYMDKLLGDIETILHSADSRSPFPRHRLDLNPAQTRVLEDHIRRFRAQLVRALAWQEIKVPEPGIPVSRAVLVNLSFVDISLDELRPKNMRGSGELPAEIADQLNGVLHELRALSESMQHFLRQDMVGGFVARLQRLEARGGDLSLLKAIQEVVTRNGLVEFRPRLDALVSRLEDSSYEIALFGRVSSGKSSLLNALLSADVLPVGINPITSIPTKLQYGEKTGALISFADGRSEKIGIEDLPQFVSEQGNPGNLKGIVKATVQVPSPRLKQEIILVDTPGLGSLAKQGAQETLAYLPSCDLALLLIDAGSTLNEEDIATLRLLYEAGIPPLVLLSKVDLLDTNELPQATAYIERQIADQLEISIKAYPVSALPNHKSWIEDFYHQILLPLFDQAREMRMSSIARKIGTLREAIIATLQARTDRNQQQSIQNRDEAENAENELRRITGSIGELSTLLDYGFSVLDSSSETITKEVADEAATYLIATREKFVSPIYLSEALHSAIDRRVAPLLQQAQSRSSDALNILRTVATLLHSGDSPDTEELRDLLRDVPRFEMTSLPQTIDPGMSHFWGHSAMSSRIRKHLQQNVGGLLAKELDGYRSASLLWAQRFTQQLKYIVHSYADVYRVQLQRIQGTAGPEPLTCSKEDLNLLIHWREHQPSDEAVQQIGA